jgi:hypothetical protein
VNQIFTVTREVRDSVTHAITLPADYGQMGKLFIAVTLIGTDCADARNRVRAFLALQE